MPEETRQHSETLTLGLFLLLILFAVIIAAGFSFNLLAILVCIAAFAFALRYTYTALYLGIALSVFTGITVSIPTGALRVGDRAFGGSIDVSLAEVVMLFVLAAWASKMVLFWWKRRDRQWMPRLPLLPSYALMFLAHIASLFSPLQPDPFLVFKYAFRPVLFNYVAFVAAPVNLIRSRRRLVTALLIMACVGAFAALNGFISIFFAHPSGAFFGRAHPMSIFGVSALGENHNELAEILVWTTLASLAVSQLVKSEHLRRVLNGAAAFQFFIGLLTFTRSAWIIFILQGLFLSLTIWRESVKRHARILCIIGVLALPLVGAMLAYTVSESASSSNSTRLMLSQIAFELFRSSPFLGAGAGTYVDRVGSTRIFLLEYGDPLDSHGFLQKLGAETGLLGLVALAMVYLQFFRLVMHRSRQIASDRARRAFLLLSVGAASAFMYQLFNTDYWTAKMWLPVGLALAASAVLKETPRDILEP